MSTTTHPERRNGSRHIFRGYGTLAANNFNADIHLINLSHDGALIAVLDPHELKKETEITLTLDLDSLGQAIMQGKIVHLKEHFIGLECTPAKEEDIKKVSQALKGAAKTG